MTPKFFNRLLATLHILFSLYLIGLRVSAFGWAMLIFGFIIIPVMLFHLVAGAFLFLKFSRLSTLHRLILLLCWILFIVFVLLQSDASDNDSWLVIEQVYYSPDGLSIDGKPLMDAVPWLLPYGSGVLMVAAEIFLLIKSGKKSKKAVIEEKL